MPLRKFLAYSPGTLAGVAGSAGFHFSSVDMLPYASATMPLSSCSSADCLRRSVKIPWRHVATLGLLQCGIAVVERSVTPLLPSMPAFYEVR